MSKRVIHFPVITEKSNIQKEKSNQYVFQVAPDAGKIEIRKTVENNFGVTVTKVRTLSTHGKIKTYGRFKGRRPDCKRAIVTLKEGDSINFFESV